MFGEPCDPDRIVADLDRLADGQLTVEEVQTYTEEIEAELEQERRDRPCGRGRFAEWTHA